MSVNTNCSAFDCNISSTRAGTVVMKTINARNLLGSCIFVKSHCISEITHSTVSTTTIYIMIYSGSLTFCLTDGYIGVTIDLSGTCGIYVSATATIDITHRSSTIVDIAYIIITICYGSPVNTNSTAVDGHISITILGRRFLFHQGARQRFTKNSLCLIRSQNFRLTYSSHLTTAIDAGLHRTTSHGDFCATLHTSCDILGISFSISGISRIST